MPDLAFDDYERKAMIRSDVEASSPQLGRWLWPGVSLGAAIAITVLVLSVGERFDDALRVAFAIAAAALWIAFGYSCALVLSVTRHWQLEPRRKLVHVFTGTVLSVFCLTASVPGSLALAALLALMAYLIRRVRVLRWRFGGVLHGPARAASYGEIYFPAGYALASLLTGAKPEFMLPGILIVTYADAAAALVGVRYGRRIFGVPWLGKSVEGSLAFLAITLAILCFFQAPVPGLRATWPAVVSLALFLTAVELVSRKGSDNLFLLLATSVLLPALENARA